MDEARQDLLPQLSLQETPCYLVKAGLLEKVLPTIHSQGIAAIAVQPQWSWEDVASMEQIIIIDGVQDPGNLGTIVRTALASDTQAMLCLSGTVDLYNDKTLRATMGAIFRLPVRELGQQILSRFIHKHHLYRAMLQGLLHKAQALRHKFPVLLSIFFLLQRFTTFQPLILL